MAQTYGSQLLGPLYDILGWMVMVGFFTFLGLGQGGAVRAQLPPWMLERRYCFGIAGLSALMAVAKLFHWF